MLHSHNGTPGIAAWRRGRAVVLGSQGGSRERDSLTLKQELPSWLDKPSNATTTVKLAGLQQSVHLNQLPYELE